MGFELDPSYKGVPERIADFLAKHPEGSLRPVDPARPYWVETIGDKTFIVYAAAAFRTPDDPSPGIGVAWEPFPGKTPYTKESELQNAETSAWGRAIVASLASQSKSIASAEDVRNRDPSNVDPETGEIDPEQWFKENGWQDKAEHDAAVVALVEDVKGKLTDDGRVSFKEWCAEMGLTLTRAVTREHMTEMQGQVALLAAPVLKPYAPDEEPF